MVVTSGKQYNVGEKPTVILYTYINRHVVSCCCFAVKKSVCFSMVVLMGVITADVYNVPVPMTPLHVSLLLDFTATAVAEEL